jgi:hypothetical protein
MFEKLKGKVVKEIMTEEEPSGLTDASSKEITKMKIIFTDNSYMYISAEFMEECFFCYLDVDVEIK